MKLWCILLLSLMAGCVSAKKEEYHKEKHLNHKKPLHHKSWKYPEADNGHPFHQGKETARVKEVMQHAPFHVSYDEAALQSHLDDDRDDDRRRHKQSWHKQDLHLQTLNHPQSDQPHHTFHRPEHKNKPKSHEYKKSHRGHKKEHRTTTNLEVFKPSRPLIRSYTPPINVGHEVKPAKRQIQEKKAKFLLKSLHEKPLKTKKAKKNSEKNKKKGYKSKGHIIW